MSIAKGQMVDSGVDENSESFLAEVSALVSARPGRPSWDEYFMATSLLIASRSPCERLHVGCVLVSGGTHKNRIIAAGYNGFLPSSPHLSRVRDGHEQGTVHAEQNAIADAARRGISVQGATAYISHFPCIQCAKVLAAAGIQKIKYFYDYRNDPMVTEILEESGIILESLSSNG
ncbi:MAG: deaminase [Verrucomicrobiota bacterium]